MKNFHRTLFIIVAAALCGLCVFQWKMQTQQRDEIEKLGDQVYRRDAAIQGYTNSLKNLDAQVAQMQSQIVGLERINKSNAQVVVEQKRELFELNASVRSHSNEIAGYKLAVGQLETKLKDAYDGIKKQNAAVKELVQKREELVKKVNDAVTERNGVVNKYNDLVHQIEQMQSTQQKQKTQ
jgi:chromosome segregation ATPase